jgi:hypothetical protein
VTDKVSHTYKTKDKIIVLLILIFTFLDIKREHKYAPRCLFIALMMEVASTSETSVNFYYTTRHYITEDSHVHTHRHENLKSHHRMGCRTYVFLARPHVSTSKSLKRLPCNLALSGGVSAPNVVRGILFRPISVQYKPYFTWSSNKSS